MNRSDTDLRGHRRSHHLDPLSPATWPISVEIVMDAVAMRLLEIGEAVKGISPELTALEPEIPWSDIAGMRDFLAYHYFATNPEIIQLTIDKRLSPLAEAVDRLTAHLTPEG